MKKESLEILLDRVAAWSEEDQEKVARFIEEIESTRRVRTGQLASDEEVAAVFNRYS